MWAVWSTKARGGYAEVLFLGEALLLATLPLCRRRSRKLAAAVGRCWPGWPSGPICWRSSTCCRASRSTWRLRRRTQPDRRRAGLAVAGAAGHAAAADRQRRHGLPTLDALLQPPDISARLRSPSSCASSASACRCCSASASRRPPDAVRPRLAARGRPVRPGSPLLAVGLLVAALALAPAVAQGAGRRAARSREAEPGTAADGGRCVVPPVVALTRFGFFVSEPRYALPLYSRVPLLAARCGACPQPGLARAGVVAAVLVFNVLEPHVDRRRGCGAPRSTRQHRRHPRRAGPLLVAQDRHQIYTDYWIGYPIMFETRETVLAYVISGGFNRYMPPADNVQRTPNPAWVFTPGQPAEAEFLATLAEARGQARDERRRLGLPRLHRRRAAGGDAPRASRRLLGPGQWATAQLAAAAGTRAARGPRRAPRAAPARPPSTRMLRHSTCNASSRSAVSR